MAASGITPAARTPRTTKESMMKLRAWMLVPLAGALVAFGCSGARDVKSDSRHAAYSGDGDEDDDEEESEELVALAQVPQAVKKAAQDAVPGIVLKEAERETGKSGVVYCVHGTAAGEFVEVEVSASGEVLEIERGDDDDEGDDD
jgi:hypothetical protein